MAAMNLVNLVVTVILVSSSGFLAPCPLFLSTVLRGVRHGARAGVAVSAGHTAVGLPMVLLLAFGLLTLLDESVIRAVVGIAGGSALLFFGALQAYGVARRRVRLESENHARLSRGSFVTGLVFTALNPFPIAWWLTVGAKLIVVALLAASLLGVLAMYGAHIWMDYAWLVFTAHASRMGEASLTRIHTGSCC